MTLRSAKNALTGDPVGAVKVLLGFDRDGRPLVSIRPGPARSGVKNIADPAVLRRLIADLTEALEHLS